VNAYEHGWPLRYATRTTYESAEDWIEQPDGTLVFDWKSAWQPWSASLDVSLLALVLDTAFWTLMVSLVGIGAQYWRSKRRAVWQVGLRDLLVLTAFVGVACAWYVSERRDCLRERTLALDTRISEQGNRVYVEDYRTAAVPAWLPESAWERWHQWFGRARFAESHGNSAIACQLRGLLSLQEDQPSLDFPQHLQRMPQLEALDLGHAFLPYLDESETSTVLARCPPMPNLRGINLYETNVKDADLEWLARCRRLERIELSGTDIGERGLAHLSRLPAVRTLTLWSCDISDEGCHSLAKMQSLEGLAVSSRHITAAGVAALGDLRNLRRLSIRASATEAEAEALRIRLPGCEIDFQSY
jgi:hypothetical protein